MRLSRFIQTLREIDERLLLVGQGYWVSPRGKVIEAGSEHRDEILKDPELFGLRGEQLMNPDGSVPNLEFMAVMNGWTKVTTFKQYLAMWAPDILALKRAYYVLMRTEPQLRDSINSLSYSIGDGTSQKGKSLTIHPSQLSTLTEIYSSDNSALLRYLKAAEIDHYQFWPQFENWFQAYKREFTPVEVKQVRKVFDEEDPESFHEMPQTVQKEFEAWCRETGMHDIMQNEPAEAPTWAHVDVQGKRLIDRETWLIHFSDHARDIAREGFKKGVYDMTKLGLTTNLSAYERSHPGYNFAFLAGTRAVVNHHAGYSGRSAVMFQNSGVHTYHYGDEFDQIIFNGPDVNPKSIIWLTSDGGSEWFVHPHPSKSRPYPQDSVYKGDLNQVQDWVMKNAQQYRRVITGW